MTSFYKNKNILVTGAAGFVGTNLVRRLVDLGANVTGTIFNKKPQDPIESVKYIKVDLTNKVDCAKVCIGIDFVFMCAANSSGASVMEKAPLTHLTPNVVMNALMLEAAYSEGVQKFAFISSNTVYPLTNNAVAEADANYDFYEKYHIVGWMKMFSEEMCKMYSNHIKAPMKTLVVRPGNLYGPFDKYNKNESKVIAALVRRFVEKQNPLEVWGDGNDIKDFIFIDDFIDGLISTFKNEKIEGPINIASGEPTTIKDIINALILISESSELNVQYDSSKPTMIPVRLISTELVKKEINFSPKYSIYEGLDKTYNWYQQYYKKFTPEDLI